MGMILVELDSYYKENLQKLITKMENSLEQTLEVIDKKIDEKISDDKYLNVLKAKRQAADDFIWFLKRIGELKRELLGVEEEEEDPTGSSTNLAKMRAERKRKDNEK